MDGHFFVLTHNAVGLSSKDDEHELSAFDEITDSSYLRTEGVLLGPKFAAERLQIRLFLI